MKESPSRNEKKPFFTPHLWLIVLLYLLITVSHYSLPPFFSGLPTSFLGLARHSIERVLLLVPISYAGVACPPYKTLAGGAFGIVGGIVSLAISLVIMLPQAFLLSQGAGVFLEIAGVLLIGTVINLWLFTHRREVAERKRVEGMLTKIIDASSIPAFVIDREHKVTHWNTALESLSGIRREEVLGTSEQWRAFYADKRPVMADLIVDGAPGEEIEARYRGCRKNELIEGAYEAEGLFLARGNGGKEERWLRFTASPIKDASGTIVGAVETLEDVTNRRIAEQNLRIYLQEITRAQEEERKRIARELHDDTTQNLIALLRRLDNLLNGETELPPAEARVVEELHEQVKGILQEVRRFSRDLRPSILDHLGLIPALEWATEELKKDYGIQTSLKVVGAERRLVPEAELLLFRIVQEALRNTARHSRASRVEVIVRFVEDKTEITVSDNGIGFELPEDLGVLPHTGKLGLAGMKERVELLGGSLELKSEPGKGTTVLVAAPV